MVTLFSLQSSFDPGLWLKRLIHQTVNEQDVEWSGEFFTDHI
jgi:hypothetical protein